MKKVLIKMIRLYQKIPGRFHDSCRFYPTCSEYTIEAINEYGSIKGTFMGLKRILRCNPFNKHTGYDPVIKKENKMKKKIISLILLFGLVLPLTGCKSDSMEDISIYTTVYPIEYITNYLYSEYSTINSIYPDGVNINEYELTSKQVADYAKSDLLIFNGLNSEKDYVTSFFKKNKNIKIIDATQSMEVDNRVEELWLNPSNFLMIAQNIKTGLTEYLTNQYIINQMNNNYDELKIEISKLDATFSTIVENANNTTVIVTDDVLLFLNKYGFNVISLDSDTANEKAYATAKELLNNGSSNTIFSLTNDEISDKVQVILDDTNKKITYLHNLSNITEEERNNKDTYISLMNENIELLKNELYK